MANPVIDGIDVIPNPVPVGEGTKITIRAHDPDAKVISFVGTVTDADGNASQATGTIIVADPLTYELVADEGTVTVDPSSPNVFHWSPA